MFTIAAVREVAEDFGTAGRPHLRPLIDFRAGLHGLLWARGGCAVRAGRWHAVRSGAGALAVELPMEPEFRSAGPPAAYVRP